MKPFFYLTVILLGPAQAVDFEKEILPLLEEKCFDCHSDKAGKKKSGVAFDSTEEMESLIGDHNFIVPGKPEESSLVGNVIGGDDYELMPPVGKGDPFTSAEIKKLRQWISEGASLDKDMAAEGDSGGLMDRKGNPERTWTNAAGRAIKATLVKFENGTAHLRMANGKVYPVPVNTLSEDSQKQVAEDATALKETDEEE